MKIDKEKFNKLKQLDRIEFRQRASLIGEYYKIGVGSFFLKITLFFTGFCLLLAPQGYLLWGQEFISDLYYFGSSVIGFFILVSILGYAIDIVLIYLESREKKKLEKEYFDFKVEVKK